MNKHLEFTGILFLAATVLVLAPVRGQLRQRKSSTSSTTSQTTEPTGAYGSAASVGLYV